MASYFITGIAGFLGNNLAKEIQAADPAADIVGFVQTGDPCIYLDKERIRLIEGDLFDLESIERFLSTPVKDGKRHLIHVAGRISVYRNNDPLTTKVNVKGTENVLAAALSHHIDRFVYVSSVDALSKVEMGKKILEQETYDPDVLEGVYSKSKAIASNLVLKARQCGMETLVVLPSAILGPNDPGRSPINDAIARFLKGKLPAVVEGAYDLVDVRDVAKGIVLVLAQGQSGESYLLTGNHCEVIDLIGLAAEASGKKPVKLKVPTFLVKMASPFIEIDARKRCKTPLFTSFAIDCLRQNSDYSHDKASSLGYQPRPLKKTVEDTVAWMKESGYLER